jgi:signal recognition particle receptor subunit alpha
MLESFTIFNSGGLVLFQYLANPSLMVRPAADGASGDSTTAEASSQLPIDYTNFPAFKDSSVSAEPSSANAAASTAAVSGSGGHLPFTITALNEQLIAKILLQQHTLQKKPSSTSSSATPSVPETGGDIVFASDNPALNPTKRVHVYQNVTFAWLYDSDVSEEKENSPVDTATHDFVYVAIFPDIMFQGPRMYLQNWIQSLLYHVVLEYRTFYWGASSNPSMLNALGKPKQSLFDPTFAVLLTQSKHQKHNTNQVGAKLGASSTPSLVEEEAEEEKEAPESTNKKSKEKRNWHDGKVTSATMAALDKSGADGNDEAAALERALAEARAAYLPTSTVEEEEAKQVGQEIVSKPAQSSSGTNESSWSATMTGLFQQLTGNKILTAADLQGPLKSVETLLTKKNVASEIAQELCASIQQELVGKKLNSMFRVQTAVSQALEAQVTKILKKSQSIDMLREVIRQRGSRNRPYVISVVGINGVGKSTSLAKLAYYLKQNGCHPLIVAGDTFRSGAVEQLKVHATCLDIPLFSQGYSKDPSAVATAAIAQAMSDSAGGDGGGKGQRHDVVLIDTAGRMQNNVPLMKALGKLVAENQPDLVLLVCEALVGHDGLSQYKMFQDAIATGVGVAKSKSSSRRPPGIHGLILTKFDTVSDKVGAALTMTSQTGAPIVFCGVGQKYHHLKKLSVPAVVASLLSAE